jgi:hypothetical protein
MSCALFACSSAHFLVISRFSFSCLISSAFVTPSKH